MYERFVFIIVGSIVSAYIYRRCKKERTMEMMKRFIVAVMVIVSVLFCGCDISNAETKTTTTTVWDLVNAYQNIQDGGILEVDYYGLDKLSKEMRETQFRICGVLTEVKESSGLIGCSAQLVVGNNEVHIYFADNQVPVEGEYVEVVGELLSPLTVSLTDCRITERGDSVRERIKN